MISMVMLCSLSMLIDEFRHSVAISSSNFNFVAGFTYSTLQIIVLFILIVTINPT